MAENKIVQFQRNRESAAAMDWQAVADPIARVILTARHLGRDGALATRPLLLLGEMARDAESALALNRQILKTGYTAALDDGIERLGRRMAGTATLLDGYVHADYVAFMRVACVDLQAAVAARRTGRLGAEGLLRRSGSQ